MRKAQQTDKVRVVVEVVEGANSAAWTKLWLWLLEDDGDEGLRAGTARFDDEYKFKGGEHVSEG